MEIKQIRQIINNLQTEVPKSYKTEFLKQIYRGGFSKAKTQIEELLEPLAQQDEIAKAQHKLQLVNNEVQQALKKLSKVRQLSKKIKLRRSKTLEQRFLEKVNKEEGLGPEGDCWLWT